MRLAGLGRPCSPGSAEVGGMYPNRPCAPREDEPCSVAEEEGSWMGEGLGDLLWGREGEGDSCGEEAGREPRWGLEAIEGRERRA